MGRAPDPQRGAKGVRNLLPERPFGCSVQKVPDTFFATGRRGRCRGWFRRVLLAACAGLWSWGGPGLAGPSAAAGEIQLTPVPGGDFRGKDILGQAYAAGYAYSYDNAVVKITLDPTSRHLSGTLTATGLKPNFAYQLKLVGDPALAGDGTNEQLGYLGRWWLLAPEQRNSTDAEYSEHAGEFGWVFQGYLVFGFLVTDQNGAATVSFKARSSFHVLWRTDQRARTAADGPLVDVELPPTEGNPAYDVSLPGRATQLYGEHEPTRAAPGTLRLPAAQYTCGFLLTEESFHDSGEGAGSWAAALQASIQFDVTANPPALAAGPQATPGTVAGKTTSLSVLASDDGGEADLIYTWSAAAKPSGAPDPAFSANGTNAAKNATATFAKPGLYTLRATVADQDGMTVSGTVDVTVAQTPTTITVAPSRASLRPGQTVQFTATARDQFKGALVSQPAISWTVSGGGSISSSGLFRAASSGHGYFRVRASAGGASGTAVVSVGYGSGGGGGCALAAVPPGTEQALGWALPYAALVLNGLFLAASNFFGVETRRLRDMTAGDSLLIGLAQAVAITPGISRSGSTIAAGLVCGMQREEAFTFSFLLGMPAIAGATLLEAREIKALALSGSWGGLVAGFVVAFVAGLVSIWVLGKIVKRRNLLPFGLYTIALAFAVLVIWIIKT